MHGSDTRKTDSKKRKKVPWPAAVPIRQWAQHVGASLTIPQGSPRPLPVPSPQPAGRDREKRLKDHVEGPALGIGFANECAGVLPLTWNRRPPVVETPKTRVIGGKHFSLIDGLPLPCGHLSLVRRPPPAVEGEGASRSRSRSTARQSSGSSAAGAYGGESGGSSSSRAGRGPPGTRQSRATRGQPALYFVDCLVHRTLARCAACSRALAGEDRWSGAAHFPAPPGLPCVLGFRVALSPLGEQQVWWAHAVPACLSKLGLPRLEPEAVSRDVVFSPGVSEESRSSVLNSLLAACAAHRRNCRAPGSGELGSESPRTLHLERWNYRPAVSHQWAHGDTVNGLSTTVLTADDIQRMGEKNGVSPLCVICMQDFAVGESTVRLPCAHQFHAACASEWLRRRPVCPLDLAPVDP